MNMIDRAARELFLADRAFRWPDRTWDELTDDDREPYRRMARRMFDAAGVLGEDREYETTEADVLHDAAAVEELR